MEEKARFLAINTELRSMSSMRCISRIWNLILAGPWIEVRFPISGNAVFRWEVGSQVPGPSSAVSGANVLGYNLAGNYGDNLAAEDAIHPAINATGFEHVVLSFYDWLSIEQNPLDRAALQVSADGSTWTTIYENPLEPLFATQWSYREFDISAIADRH